MYYKMEKAKNNLQACVKSNFQYSTLLTNTSTVNYFLQGQLIQDQPKCKEVFTLNQYKNLLNRNTFLTKILRQNGKQIRKLVASVHSKSFFGFPSAI